jgi:hypothetical protein
MSWSPIAATLAFLALSLPSCTYASGTSTVLVTSTPAGATILVDGQNTGVTTPALLDMGTTLNLDGFFGRDKKVTIRKKGFEPESRMIYHHQDFYTAKWIEGSTNFWFLTAPLFWTFGDFFLPFGTRWAYSPHELHVRLYPEGEAPGTGK